jgi:threonine/homoserine/homoserine lactone efflux protein
MIFCGLPSVTEMTLHSYLLFVGASIVLVLVPGPDMIYMLGRCIAQGKRAGLMAAVGFNLGSYVHLTAAALGLSAVLATSAVAFNIVKWIGAAYLIYLGISVLRSRGGPIDVNAQSLPPVGARSILWQAFLSDLLNPKVALFFLALLPQFVSPHAAHPTLQILLLGVTVNMIAILGNVTLVLLATSVTKMLRRKTSFAARLNKAMGAMFIALGIRMAFEKAP